MNECIDAYQMYHNNLPRKTHEIKTTRVFNGCIGAPNNPSCDFYIVLTLTYFGDTVEGNYAVENDASKNQKVSGFSNTKDDLSLRLIKENGRYASWKFKGTQDHGVIKGLWSKGGGKKQYTLYVETSEDDQASKTIASEIKGEEARIKKKENEFQKKEEQNSIPVKKITNQVDKKPSSQQEENLDNSSCMFSLNIPKLAFTLFALFQFLL